MAKYLTKHSTIKYTCSWRYKLLILLIVFPCFLGLTFSLVGMSLGMFSIFGVTCISLYLCRSVSLFLSYNCFICFAHIKKLYDPFYGWGVTASRQLSHYKEVVYFLPLSSQKFLIFILLTSIGWKADSSLKLHSCFKLGNPGMGIQCLNH